MSLKPFVLTGLPVYLLAACGGASSGSDTSNQDSTATDSVVILEDKHSYSNVNEVYSTHLHLDLTVDFDQHKLIGSVEHHIENPTQSTQMILDMNDEKILKVSLDDDTTGVDFTVGEDDELIKHLD